jgi:hypothetical protein
MSNLLAWSSKPSNCGRLRLEVRQVDCLGRRYCGPDGGHISFPVTEAFFIDGKSSIAHALCFPPALPIITGTAKIWRRVLPCLEPSGSAGPLRMGIMIPFPPHAPTSKEGRGHRSHTLRRGIRRSLVLQVRRRPPHAPTIPAQDQASRTRWAAREQ